jgi:hypothetical protein
MAIVIGNMYAAYCTGELIDSPNLSAMGLGNWHHDTVYFYALDIDTFTFGTKLKLEHIVSNQQHGWFGH